MCRYGFSLYKPHFVCFDCRKMFRRRLLKDVDRDAEISMDAKCPQCGSLMCDMGLDFKPPQKDDMKAWKHIRDLYAIGITFHSCGCSGPGYIPSNREDILKKLNDTKDVYIQNRRIWNKIELPETKADFHIFHQQNYQTIAGSLPNELYQLYKKRKLDKKSAVLYWTDKINEIEDYISSLS